MAITINGDSGISGVDGSAATPALQGTDSNTGISFGTDEVNINTGGTTRVKVDSSGRLGLGTSSPSSLLHVAGSSPAISLIPSGATNAKFIFDNSLTFSGSGGSNDRLHISFDGKVGIGTTAPDANLDVRGSNASILISDSGRTQYWRIQNNETSDALVFNANDTSERLRILPGGGITFNGDTAAANALDDYEEGTWTPNQGSGLTVSGAFSSVGYYTKIGNTVSVIGYVKGATSVSCAAAGIICTNLPFTGTSGLFGVGSTLSWNADSNSSCGQQQNTANLYNGTAITASDRLSFQVTYRVA